MGERFEHRFEQPRTQIDSNALFHITRFGGFMRTIAVVFRSGSWFLSILLGAISMVACTSQSGGQNEIEQVDDALTGLERDLENSPDDVDLCLDYASICEHAAGICLHVELASHITRCTNMADRCESNLGTYCSGVDVYPSPHHDGGGVEPGPRDAGVHDAGIFPHRDGWSPLPRYDAGSPVPRYDAGVGSPRDGGLTF